MNKWKLISTGYIGNIFECEACGYRTVYLGSGKLPTYDCINCFEKETNMGDIKEPEQEDMLKLAREALNSERLVDKEQADNIFKSMAH